MSIWFDIPPSDIIPCTPQMVKRFKRARGKYQQQQQRQIASGKQSDAPFPPLPFHVNIVESTSNESFNTVLYQPFFYMNLALNDNASKDLIKSILLHRIHFLRFHDSFRFIENCTMLSIEEQKLQKKFWDLKDGMNKWSWPVAQGRETVDENTKIPECNALYCLRSEKQEKKPGNGMQGTNTVADGYVAPLWASFVKTFDGASDDDVRVTPEEDTQLGSIPAFDLVISANAATATTTLSRSKVKIFRDFSQGDGVGLSDFMLPRLSDKYSKSVPSEEYCRPESTFAWKHILLDGAHGGSDDGDSELSANAWDLVKEHYLTTERSSSSNESTPSASIGGSQSSSSRDQALPLSVAGEKRETIFSKLAMAKVPIH